MAPEIKFCGITRAEDARWASELGANYVGVIFAGGPRHRTESQANEILSEVSKATKKVGVFASQNADEILALADRLALHVLQLHAPAATEQFQTLRASFPGEVWIVERIRGGEIPRSLLERAPLADGVLLDAHVPGALGGTGVALPWAALAESSGELRHVTRLILAGGLRPENVRAAIQAIGPDVVDVSSGVEASAGIKDHDRMRDFRDAVTGAAVL